MASDYSSISLTSKESLTSTTSGTFFLSLATTTLSMVMLMIEVCCSCSLLLGIVSYTYWFLCVSGVLLFDIDDSYFDYMVPLLYD